MHAARQHIEASRPMIHGSSAARGPRLWPRHQRNGGAPADPFPAGPVLPLNRPSRYSEAAASLANAKSMLTG